MGIRVIVPPAPLLTPEKIPGSHAANDASVARMIMAAQRTIDGPTGWLGRALGPQTLEIIGADFRGWNLTLPCRPVSEIVSVKYLDAAGTVQTYADTGYRLVDGRIWFNSVASSPALYSAPDAVRIRYRAGYNGGDPETEEKATGPVPEEALLAIIVMVQHMISVGAENLFLRSETVEGVGSMQYTVSDQAGTLVQRTVENLLSGLRVRSA